MLRNKILIAFIGIMFTATLLVAQKKSQRFEDLETTTLIVNGFDIEFLRANFPRKKEEKIQAKYKGLNESLKSGMEKYKYEYKFAGFNPRHVPSAGFYVGQYVDSLDVNEYPISKYRYVLYPNIYAFTGAKKINEISSKTPYWTFYIYDRKKEKSYKIRNYISTLGMKKLQSFSRITKALNRN